MQQPRRVRELGIIPGTLPTGRLNGITDVPGIRVGQTTIDNGADLHTGVTAIVPDALDRPSPTGGDSKSGAGRADGAGIGGPGTGRDPGTTRGMGLGSQPGLAAAVAVGNGYGKLVGSTQIDELGVIETPILLTGTLSVFRVADALLTYLLDRNPTATSLNPVVGETNDGFLSDIRRRPITLDHVFAALESASTDLPAEGCVGAGTGTIALDYKAGIGTSSRLVPATHSPAAQAPAVHTSAAQFSTPQALAAQTSATPAPAGTVGVLAQANFSGLLTVLGTPIPAATAQPTPPGNSCMIVVATDLPLDARQLGRLARRAIFAMGRVGSDFSPGSGDYAIALSTTPSTQPFPEYHLKTPFQAVTEATEEALLNSLTMAHTVTGFRGTTFHAVPHEAISNRR